jgi:hypothetical protein
MADPLFKELAYTALAQTARNPTQDFLRATPRNPVLGYLSDLAASSYAPQRTQQMQGIAQFLGIPAISQTLDRLSYGEPLTTGSGGIGGTTRIRPEAIEAAMMVAPMAGPAARMTKGLPVGMSIKDVSKAFPQEEALKLAQQRAALPVEKGGLGLGPNNTAAERAAAMGFSDDVYHGTKAQEIKQFDMSKVGSETVLPASAPKAIYTAKDPMLSSRYGSGDGQNVLPLLVNPQNVALNNSKIIALDNVDNIRSRFAAFDPFRKTAATAATMGVAAPDLLAQENPSISDAEQQARIMLDIGQDPYTIYQQTGIWLGGNE